MRKVAFYLLLVVVPAFFALGIGEIVLRTKDPSKITSGWKDIYQLIFVNYQHKQTNQLGYRGKSIDIEPNDFVVLLVGDSQVECIACRDQHLPEDALREHLASLMNDRRVKVFQVGASGYGADQEFLAVRSYFAKGYRADVVLLWQTLGNDIMDAIFPMSSTEFGVGHLKPTFRLDAQGKLIWPTSDIGDLFCDFYIECIYLIQRYGSLDGYWDQFLPAAALPINEASSSQIPIVDSKDSVEYEKSMWGNFMLPPSPRKQYGIALTRSLYKEIQAESARHNARFVIFDVNRTTNEAVEATKKFPQGRLDQQLVRHNGKLFFAGGADIIRGVSEEVNRGFEFVVVVMDIPNHVVSDSDPHLNENGNNRVMEQIAVDLVGRSWVAPVGAIH